MLSQHNRRTLAEIEDHLRGSDPELAHLLERFNDWAPPRRRGLGSRRRVIGLVGLWIGTLLLAIAFIDGSADALVLALAALFLDAMWWASCLVNAWVQAHHDRRRTPPAAKRP
jgi:hypothetical protein